MTDCDILYEEAPEEHLATCPACARLHRGLALAGAPAPTALTDDFRLRLTLALERPDPRSLWGQTVRRVRQSLTAAAAVAALITAGWVAREVPAAYQLDSQTVQRVVNRAGYR